MNVLLLRDNLLSTTQKEQLEEKNVVLKTIASNTFKSFQESSENFDFDYIVGATELCDLNLAKFPNLRFIQLISAGYDYLKLSEILEKNIVIFNASGVYSVPIAEWVIGLILADYKRFVRFYNKYKENDWNPTYDLKELTNKRVLIYGTGSIGEEIAKRLFAFDCIIDGVNSNGRNVKFFNKCFSLESAKNESKEYDILIFALPSNQNTRNYINANFLSNLKEDAIIMNVGRGDLINENDLLEFVNTSNNVRFYLDVVNTEPLTKNSKLWQNSKIFISPHVSFSSDKHKSRLNTLIYSNINSIIDESPTINKVKGAL